MGLIDIGANLAGESFHHDLDTVLTRAWEAGLDRIIVTGSSHESTRRAVELAQRYPGKLYATAGLHPHHASEWNPELEALFRDLAQRRQVVSMGECGLDYFRDLSPRQDQRAAFLAQLEIAAELKMPLFLHQRDAHEDFLAILRQWRPRLAPPARPGRAGRRRNRTPASPCARPRRARPAASRASRRTGRVRPRGPAGRPRRAPQRPPARCRARRTGRDRCAASPSRRRPRHRHRPAAAPASPRRSRRGR